MLQAEQRERWELHYWWQCFPLKSEKRLSGGNIALYTKFHLPVPVAGYVFDKLKEQNAILTEMP